MTTESPIKSHSYLHHWWPLGGHRHHHQPWAHSPSDNWASSVAPSSPRPLRWSTMENAADIAWRSVPGLVMTNVAIENGPVEIVDLPIEKGGSFHSSVKLPEGKTWRFQVVSWTAARFFSEISWPQLTCSVHLRSTRLRRLDFLPASLSLRDCAGPPPAAQRKRPSPAGVEQHWSRCSRGPGAPTPGCSPKKWDEKNSKNGISLDFKGGLWI